MNTDGNIHLYGSTMSSPMSGGNLSPISNSMSPASTQSDSSSAYNFQHLQISSNSNGKIHLVVSASFFFPFLYQILNAIYRVFRELNERKDG